jgi:hypothetical protein
MRRAKVVRWATALGLVAVLACLPWAIGRLPAGGSSVAAQSLLARVQASAKVGYSGYAESTGSLALPVTTGQFASIADLFGATTELRVWWRGNQDWRVDKITPSGEQDLVTDGTNLWSWSYESTSIELDQNVAAAGAHVPRADDLVPATLARRLLSQAQPGEVHRIASKRIAGRTAAGLSYVPAAPQSTIAHVDVWALPGSGLPVAVAVYGKSTSGGAPAVIVSSAMLDLDTGVPPSSTTVFVPPPGGQVHTQQAPDLLALASRVQNLMLPATLGGLGKDSISPPNTSVTVYGTGVTVLVAIPVFGRTGGQIRDQLTKAVGSAKTAHGITTSIGAVNLLLSDPVAVNVRRFDDGSTFHLDASVLLVGTVTGSTLQQAGVELAAMGS